MLRYLQIFVVCVIIFTISYLPTYAQDECVVKPIDEFNFTTDTGQLLYWEREDYDMNLMGTSSNFKPYNISYFDNTVSSSIDNSKIAWTEYDRQEDGTYTGATLYVLDVATDQVVSRELFASEWVLPSILKWHNSDKIIILNVEFKLTPAQWHVSAIVDSYTLDINYVFPTHLDHLYEDAGIVRTPIEFLENRYRFPGLSPNVDYIKMYSHDYGGYTWFGFWTGEPLILENIRSDSWVSPHVLANIVNPYDSEVLEIYLYDILEDRIFFSLTLPVDNTLNEYFTFANYALSPDKQQFVVQHKTGGYEYPLYIWLLDLQTSEFKPTCFHEFKNTRFQHKWSFNGRYLAFYGVLETETDAETGTIYIYDTQTDIAYEVFTGDARIIGWAKLGDE